MARKKSTAKKGTRAKKTRTIETLTHDKASRKNIPTAEFQSVMGKEAQKPVPTSKCLAQRKASGRKLSLKQVYDTIWKGSFPALVAGPSGCISAMVKVS